MSKPITETDLHNRGRWRRYLQDAGVGTAAIPKKRLSDLLNRGDLRSEITKYLSESPVPEDGRTIGADRAFMLGEAMRRLGVGWSCGAAALIAAGHVCEGICFLERLARRFNYLEVDENIRALVSLIVTLPILDWKYDQPESALLGGRLKLGPELAEEIARKVENAKKASDEVAADIQGLLSFAASQLDALFPEIWEECNRNGARQIRPFKQVFAIMQDAQDMDDRARGWSFLASASQQRYPSLFSGNTSRVTLYAPFVDFLTQYAPGRFGGAYPEALYRIGLDGGRIA